MHKGKFTAEERKRISESLKRAYREGRAHSPALRADVKEKIRASKQGKPRSEDTKRKIAETLRARIDAGKIEAPKISSEMRERARASLKGKHRSEETKQKIAAGLKQRWAEGNYASRVRHGLSAKLPTPSEERLLEEFTELGFKNQAPLQSNRTDSCGRPVYLYYDFLHPIARLIIEIDGPDHAYRGKVGERDLEKNAVAHQHGYTVMRFTNDAAVNDTANVVAEVKRKLA